MINPIDFEMSLDGDITNNSVSDNELRVQLTINRIKAIKIDWYLDHIGADLEEILGFPNTKDTQNIFENKIISALTYDNYFNSNDIYIELVSSLPTNLYYKVYIRRLDDPTLSNIISIKINLMGSVNITLEV